MQKTVGVLAMPFALGLLGAAPAHAGYGWQPIYNSPSTGIYGYSFNYSDRWSAEAAAITQCAMNDCSFAASSPLCVAVAVEPYSFHGDVGVTAFAARANAMMQNGGGTIVKVTCP